MDATRKEKERLRAGTFKGRVCSRFIFFFQRRAVILLLKQKSHFLPVIIPCSGGKLALSLLSNTAFSLGVTVISNFEERQLGLQWTNAAEPLSIEDPLNMGAVYGMLICDIVLYMLIAWCVTVFSIQSLCVLKYEFSLPICFGYACIYAWQELLQHNA